MQRLRSRGWMCPLFSFFVSLQAREDPLAAPSPVPTCPPGFALGDLQGSKLVHPLAAPASLKAPPFHVCALAGRGCAPKMMRLKSSRCCHRPYPLWSLGRTPPACRALSKWGPPLGSQGIRSLGGDRQAKGGELGGEWMYLESSTPRQTVPVASRQ